MNTLPSYDSEITEREDRIFRRVISTDLSREQQGWISQPKQSYPGEKQVLAVHWHPEWIPFNLIDERLDNMFPTHVREDSLIIPTQHNQLLTHHGYCGAEVDCYSGEFNQKVQLLVHCREEKGRQASVFRDMLDHTFRYRSSQLFELAESLTNSRFEDRLNRAVAETGAGSDAVDFARTHTKRFLTLFRRYESKINPLMIKNKLLRNYVDELRDEEDPILVDHGQLIIRAVKMIVKVSFDPSHFYDTRSIIEEVRSFGGGIVIPHPEQFWPILLAGYDVDGYEVWNPQSRQYTEFLVKVVNRYNSTHPSRPLLVFMGDDCHLGEKVRPPEHRDPEKSGRQIGLQPAWDDLQIRKSLILGHHSRERVIAEYKSRLA